nr:transposase [uncultured Cupriavidus sp.]
MVCVGHAAGTKRRLCACPYRRRSLGVDFGLNDGATFSSGETTANPRSVRNEMPRPAELQRQRARKTRGSVRDKRLGMQLARVHEAIGNLRREFLHKATSRATGLRTRVTALRDSANRWHAIRWNPIIERHSRSSYSLIHRVARNLHCSGRVKVAHRP